MWVDLKCPACTIYEWVQRMCIHIYICDSTFLLLLLTSSITSRSHLLAVADAFGFFFCFSVLLTRRCRASLLPFNLFDQSENVIDFFCIEMCTQRSKHWKKEEEIIRLFWTVRRLGGGPMTPYQSSLLSLKRQFDIYTCSWIVSNHSESIILLVCAYAYGAAAADVADVACKFSNKNAAFINNVIGILCIF